MKFIVVCLFVGDSDVQYLTDVLEPSRITPSTRMFDNFSFLKGAQTNSHQHLKYVAILLRRCHDVEPYRHPV